MRMFLAALALLVYIPIISAPALSAGNVKSTFGMTNLHKVDWNATSCNGEQTALQCTLSGAGPDAGPGDDGEGESDNG